MLAFNTLSTLLFCNQLLVACQHRLLSVDTGFTFSYDIIQGAWDNLIGIAYDAADRFGEQTMFVHARNSIER